ncbi:MAG: PKD domain-containing protein, partial [Cryomorphaceae bacterium]
MRKFLFFFLFVSPFLCESQIDTRFWFAAPMHTNGTAVESVNTPRNRPILMVVSTLNQPAEIVISQPANTGFAPIVINLPANSTQQVNLTPFFEDVETKPANEVLNTGLLVRATNPITAYYELRSQNNTDIWALKGKNALGTKFYTPYENTYGSNQILNGSPYLPGPRAGFVVVASEDSTTVTITPKVEVLGHPANIPFEVLLMRGQTYYVEAFDEDPANKPIGTLIESDKPIATTVKDDMIDIIVETSANADVAADQLMAYEHTGLRHIVVKGNLNNNWDRVVVLATEDNTEVFIDGDDTPILLNEGEQHVYNMEGDATFIEGSAKLYVFHASGLGKQLAGAIIPSLECTGSNQVSVVRTSSSDFVMLITIKAGSEGDFEVNGDPNVITADAFEPVPGSDGEYVFAKISPSTAQVPSGSASLITNFGDELFHLGLISRQGGATANYGYSSAYSFLNIGTNTEVCLNDTLTLDAGPGKTAYIWSTGEETQTIQVTQPGTYFVEAFSGSDCSAIDTVNVTFYEPPIDLGPNDTICDGTSTTFTIDGNYLLTWPDGSSGPSYEVSEEGFVTVEVTDFQGCALLDSTFISVRPRPATPEISGDDVYCEGETLELSLSDAEDAGYRFVRPDGTVAFSQNLTIENLSLDDAGDYLGFVVVEGCESFNDTISVEVIAAPQVTLPDDQEFCDGESFIIEPTVVGDSESFSWQDGSDTPTFVATESGTYTLEVLNAQGCSGTDEVELTFNPQPEDPELSEIDVVCEGETLTVSTQGEDGVTYTWRNELGEEIFTGNPLVFESATTALNGGYTVEASIGDCFSEPVDFSLLVASSPSVVLPNDTTICTGDEIELSTTLDFENYLWSTGEVEPTITVSEGFYEVNVTDAFGCEGSASIEVTEDGPIADFNYVPTGAIQPEVVVEFTDLSDAGESNIVGYQWNFDDGGTSTAQNPDHQYATTGVFMVTLTVTDANGCESTATEEVVISFDFRIPEGFSPNGDGVNDLFIIQGLEEFPGTTVQIFNRWGAVVFE